MIAYHQILTFSAPPKILQCNLQRSLINSTKYDYQCLNIIYFITTHGYTKSFITGFRVLRSCEIYIKALKKN